MSPPISTRTASSGYGIACGQGAELERHVLGEVGGVWVVAVSGPLFPTAKATGRPPVDRRMMVEATVWRFRTGAPLRDVPERFGNWNTIYKNFNRWSEQGVWARVLEETQSLAQQSGDLDWIASIDSTTVRVHQHGATLPRTGGFVELQEVR